MPEDSLSPHVTSTCCFVDSLKMAILKGVRWCLIVILICISLMSSEVEHFLSYVYGPSVLPPSSLEKYLFRAFAHFLIGLFVFLLLSHMSSLYILVIKPLSNGSLANLFSHTVDSLFILIMVPFLRKWDFENQMDSVISCVTVNVI